MQFKGAKIMKERALLGYGRSYVCQPFFCDCVLFREGLINMPLF